MNIYSDNTTTDNILLVRGNSGSTIGLAVKGSGNVGIGTNSPVYALTVGDGTSTKDIIVKGATSGTNGGASVGVQLGSVTSIAIGNYSDLLGGTFSNLGSIYTGGDMLFLPAGVEKMRITSGGELFIGASSFPSIPAFVGIQANTGNYNPIAIKDTGTTYGSGYRFIAFYNSSASIAGSIEHTGVTTTNYNTSSDIRLKKDLGVSIKSIIDEVIIHDFEWVEDEIIDKGVFAQELYKHKPLAVSVGKDDLTEDGKLAQPWGVDYSKLVPELIVYCQDLKQTITSLQDRLDKLENK
jgi:hypothetical protein